MSSNRPVNPSVKDPLSVADNQDNPSESPRMPRNVLNGFTLTELLIALAILSVIATFTIPKILLVQQRQKENAIAKEAAAMVAGAYQFYKHTYTADANTGMATLTPYMNYAAVDTSTIIDGEYTQGSHTCGSSSARQCLRLHNGAMLRYGNPSTDLFGGTNTTNAIWFSVDPDGVYSGSATGEGKAVEFWLYYNGRLATWGTVEPNTCRNGGTCVDPTPANDPPWFSW